MYAASHASAKRLSTCLWTRRSVHNYVRARSGTGVHARIPLLAGVTFGAEMSRGDRAKQEDAMSVACVTLPCEQLRQNILLHVQSGATRDPWYGWTCDEAGGAELAAQVVWFGCFDGHGGPQVSQLLKEKLHYVFEAADPSMVQDTVQYTRSIGGYFGRFQGGAMERWVQPELLARPPPAARTQEKARTLSELAQFVHGKSSDDMVEAESTTSTSTSATSSTTSATSTARSVGLERYMALDDDIGPQGAGVPVRHTKRHDVSHMKQACMTMEERATLAWLMMDREVQENEEYLGAGSTASVLLLHSLDVPTQPWYSSEYLALTTIQLGDTRFVLCDAETGQAHPLTQLHHPDEPTELERLSRQGAGVVTDSFGEVRFMGTLANTRSFGDTQTKRYGMTAEPDVHTHILRGSSFAFVVGFSDGISGVMSDQEVVDECCRARHPQDAARRVMKYADDLGSDDNATVICVPLKGWDKRDTAHDHTCSLRNERRSTTDLYRNRRK